METTSFTSRRPAANALPAFHLPPPSSDVPRATTDGLSPSISSVNTASSQGSQAPSMQQYTYGTSGQGHMHGTWPTPGAPSYGVSSATHAAQPSLNHQPFNGGRPAMYSQAPSMQFNHPRSSHSPATGAEGLPPPPYENVHTFQTNISGSGGGGSQGNPSGLSSAPQPPQSAMLPSHNPVSTQPPTPSSATAHADPYAHSRPPNTPSYYAQTSTPQQPSFPAYAHQPSPTQHSPTTAGPGPRGLGSIAGQPQGPTMAPPNSYRPYPYQPLSAMGGSVMTNIHQPGSQMAMIPGMGVSPYPHTMMYGHTTAAPPSERPFKCDQCVQSFSRNHDLKRHKRIHLAVKPFPCTFCSKSFSRKDALKRHRLVKGCEGKNSEGTNGSETNGTDRNGDGEESADVKKET